MIGALDLNVGVVVTNCNTEEQLRQCVSQCDLLEPSLSDFVVIDDASLIRPNPGSGRVRLLENSSNLGLTASLDRGIRECRADLVVVFDSDAYPITPFTQEVRREFAKDPSLAMAAFPTVDSHGCRTASTEQEPGLLSILLGQKLYAAIGKLMPARPLCIFTCAMVVRKSDYLAVGGFDPQFDWLDLDLDLSMEFTRIKKRLCIMEGLQAFHVGGGSPQTTSARVLRFYQNRWKLLLKHRRLPIAPVIKALILSRLVAEWIFLLVAGKFLFPHPIANEKTRGRLMIIKQFAKA
jgi:GT2 family glycosyltransferase